MSIAHRLTFFIANVRMLKKGRGAIMSHKVRIKNMSYIALGAVIIALCAWITIPFPIPFTLQTFGVFSVLFIFGGKKGFFSILLYLSLGSIGVPVFSGFNSGLGVLFGITGGFLWGFAASGALYWLCDRFLRKSKGRMLVITTAAQMLCYALGTAWYVHFMSNSAGIAAALLTCVLPYLLPDALKILLALVTAKRVEKAMGRLN